jgi:hypothetical protein
MIRRLILIGFSLLASVVVAVATFYFVTNRQGRKAWQAYEEDARRRGAKLLLAEFLQPPIPDAENFAAVPLFARLFTEQDSPKPVFKLPEAPANDRGFAIVERSQRADLPAWRKRFEKEGWLLPDAPENPADAVLGALERRDAEEWAQLVEAAARPGCRFPVAWEKSFAAKLPHTSVLMAGARWNLLRLEAHLAQGNRDAAYEDLLLGLRLAQATRHEPTLISGLIRMAMTDQALTGVWSALAAGVLDDAKLAQLDAKLAAIDALGDFVFTIDSERGGMNLMFHKLIHEPEELAKLGDIAGANGTARGVFRLYPVGWIYDSQLRMNRATDQMLAQADLARGRFQPSAAVKRMENEPLGGYWERARYLLYYLMLPAYTAVTPKCLHLHTRVQQARAACALERWRQANGGAYPETLEMLVPAFLPELPRDVMSDPLRYRRNGASHFTLHSVAMNGADDGGISEAPEARAGKAERRGRIPERKQLDWVWAYPPAAQPAP